MTPHSSTLAWKIPWVEEPGRLQSMGLLRVGHDWATSLSLFTFMHWRKKWQPTPVFLPGESQGRGSLWAAIYGVAESRTRLKRLSSSSSSNTGLLQLPCTGSLEPILSISSWVCIWWSQNGSLKLAVVRVFKSWKLGKVTQQGSFFFSFQKTC